MASVIAFDAARRPLRRSAAKPTEPGKVLLFVGVRYERMTETTYRDSPPERRDGHDDRGVGRRPA